MPDDKLPVVSEEEASPLRPTEGDSSAVHMTPSFDGLAEKMEELTTPKKSGGSVAPFRGSMAVGHASRFQEQLLEQLRAEQFELLKSLREQKVCCVSVNGGGLFFSKIFRRMKLKFKNCEWDN